MVDQQQQSEAGYERLGSQKLTLVDCVAQSVGFMGPVFSAAFIIPLIIGVNAAARGAGTSAPLAVLLAGVGVFALGWIVAQYAKRIHAAGSLYDYVTNGLGSTVGAASGWLYYAGTIILTTGLGLLIGGYVHDNLMPVVFSVDGGLLPIWVWQVIFALGLFAVLYFGVQISTRVQLTLALISVAVVLVYFLSVIVRLGGDNDFGKAFNPNPSPDGFTGIMFGVLYGVLIFVGFETAANLAEETAEPKKSIPRAVLLSVVVVSVFYIIAAYTEVAGFGFDMAVITSPDVAGAPLFALGCAGRGVRLGLHPEAPAGRRVPRHAGRLRRRGCRVDPRDLRDGARPATAGRGRGRLGEVRDADRGDRVPHGDPGGVDRRERVVGRACSRCRDLPHYFSLFVWCATFGGFALIVVYFLMSIGAIKGLASDPEKVKLWVAVILGIVMTGAAIFGSFYKVPSPTVLAPWYAVIWFVVGLVVMTVAKGRAPASVALGDLHSEIDGKEI